ncbi:hypothetical protein DPMN_080942 [Dreissena polymorpha]|uniref:Uncharacterized protein n=1 Tax=Dreissena polymorpha TaxID=45954 RepID=A0A9D3Y7R0_DREPO|nr:hypothetical protein DPMN_080942 [Dreissena polymorpha]
MMFDETAPRTSFPCQKSEQIKRLNVPQQKRKKGIHVKEKYRQWDKDYQTYEELKVSACHQCIEQGGNVVDAKLWMGFFHLQWVQSGMCIKESSYSEDAICGEIEMGNASAEELLSWNNGEESNFFGIERIEEEKK